MTPRPESNLRPEIGHVLFIDIVGYSKLLIEEQKERWRQLTAMVLATPQVTRSNNEQLVGYRPGMGWHSFFALTRKSRRNARLRSRRC